MGKAFLLKLNASTYYANIGLKHGIYNTLPWVVYGYRDGGADCLTLLKKIMQLPDCAKMTHPRLITLPKITSINRFEVVKNKIVVVNPYSANRVQSDCQRFLENIIPYLLEKGFVVYSNVIGDQQVLPGTDKLDCTKQELYVIADEIPLIISNRSGIMDYLVTTKAHKMIVYPPNRIKPFRDMYGMKHWDVDNVTEFLIDETQEMSAEIRTFLDVFTDGINNHLAYRKEGLI